MKKLIIALVAIATGVTYADIGINYNTVYGFTANGGTTGLLGDGDTALIQLINTGADGTIGTVSAGGGGMFGDDTLITSFTITADTSAGDFSEYAYYNANFTTANTPGTAVGSGLGADIFARVYQVSTADVGSKYWESGIVSAGATDGTPPAVNAFFQVDATDIVAQAGIGTQDVSVTGVDIAAFSTVIPEPATIGLMGIAAAGLFTARRKVRV